MLFINTLCWKTHIFFSLFGLCSVLHHNNVNTLERKQNSWMSVSVPEIWLFILSTVINTVHCFFQPGMSSTGPFVFKTKQNHLLPSSFGLQVAKYSLKEKQGEVYHCFRYYKLLGAQTLNISPYVTSTL